MHQLPPLPYEFSALEPFIDAQTMEIHHDRHHAKYVENLNKALEAYPDLANKPLANLLTQLDTVPEDVRTAVRNQGGGVWNHTHFWNVMAAKDAQEMISDELQAAIVLSFGGLDEFKTKFTEAATKLFGSGWVWLAKSVEGELSLHSLPNQDNPLMHGLIPVLGLDVWEHAYYLKYQNKRPDYIAAWWEVVNWGEVSENYKNDFSSFV